MRLEPSNLRRQSRGCAVTARIRGVRVAARPLPVVRVAARPLPVVRRLPTTRGRFRFDYPRRHWAVVELCDEHAADLADNPRLRLDLS